ncbi:MAG: FprA family A-type flavoprotein, partial [Alphaproteobacteria bacterium]|nr:FprA family A-type flavoprotein [Alphaproteobacteria bacterium]
MSSNTELAKNINWVGYVDWSVRDFHGYETNSGATYNSYLVKDEKTALIDTVKHFYTDNLLKNISSHTENIDYIIVNHAEPDHASGLPEVISKYPNAKIVCNKKCQNILSGYHDVSSWNFHIVKTGDVIKLGKRSLTFVETPMAHWPDSMCTYVPEEKILFSMDAFGQHFASSERFDDEVDITAVMNEAKKYYANILMLFGKPVGKALEAVSGIEIDMIAPAHGVIWRSHIDKIISAYKDWIVCKPKKKVLVIYDTMWESTKYMAQAIVDGASESGVEAKLIYVRSSGITEIATEILDASAIAFGSSTLNGEMMPMMSAAMTYIKGLRPTGKSGFAFGSYGWGRGATESI